MPHSNASQDQLEYCGSCHGCCLPDLGAKDLVSQVATEGIEDNTRCRRVDITGDNFDQRERRASIQILLPFLSKMDYENIGSSNSLSEDTLRN